LDKTGTITLGNRQASEFLPVPGMTEQELADAAQLASLADETPEGRSIVVLAKEKYGIRDRDMSSLQMTFIPFSAQTRISGVDAANLSIRKGAVDAVLNYVRVQKGIPAGNGDAGAAAAALVAIGESTARNIIALSEGVAKSGGTPLVV